MTVRFSGITTIRGANHARVLEACNKKRAEVASYPQVLAFRTTIPRTGEYLGIFLTDDDAVAFKALRKKQMPLLETLVGNMEVNHNPHLENTEMGLHQMVNESTLQDFLVQHPERDASGELHERIDCNRYVFKPGSWGAALVDGVKELFSSARVSLPRGRFDFAYDLKNPVHPIEIQEDEP